MSLLLSLRKHSRACFSFPEQPQSGVPKSPVSRRRENSLCLSVNYKTYFAPFYANEKSCGSMGMRVNNKFTIFFSASRGQSYLRRRAIEVNARTFPGTIRELWRDIFLFGKKCTVHAAAFVRLLHGESSPLPRGKA